jgi:AAA family ATP:ADP antiporter
MPGATVSNATVGGSRLGRFRAAMRESPPLAWAFLYFFCLLSGYYVLRPVREAMAASSDIEAVFPPAMIGFFLDRGVALNEFTLQVIFTLVFLIMLVLQPVYGWLVSRFPRRVFLPVIYLFFIATLLLFYAIFDSGVAGRGLAFILWITVFNLFAVAVFWSFMADLFTSEQGKRLFGFIGAGGTAGALLGPVITIALSVPLGPHNLLIAAIVFLEAAARSPGRWCRTGDSLPRRPTLNTATSSRRAAPTSSRVGET